MAEPKEYVFVNKAKGKLVINFQGVFPQDKFAQKDAKFHFTEKEYEWAKATYPHIFEGDEKRLFTEAEAAKIIGETDDLETFFGKHHTKIKAAIAKMDEAEVEDKYKFAQLNDVSETILKVLQDRILELDKEKV